MPSNISLTQITDFGQGVATQQLIYLPDSIAYALGTGGQGRVLTKIDTSTNALIYQLPLSLNEDWFRLASSSSSEFFVASVNAYNNSQQFVKAYDADGSLLWSVSFSGTAGRAQLGSDSSSNAISAINYNDSNTSRHATLEKLDAATGEIIWQHSYNQFYVDILKVGQDDSIFIGSRIGFDGAIGGITKLSSDGSIVWQSNFGTTDQDPEIYGLASTSDGGVIVIGLNNRSNATEITKYDINGNKLWDETLAIDARPYMFGYDKVNCITVDQNGNIYYLLEEYGTSLTRVGELDSAGNKLWEQYASPDNSISFQNIMVADNGSLVISACVSNAATSIYGISIDNFLLTNSASLNFIITFNNSGSLQGSAVNDTLIAFSNNSILNGLAGNDILIGGMGDDQLIGGDGNDTVNAGAGADLIIGGDGLGNDNYNGGDGIDTVKYTSALAGIVVNLNTGFATTKATTTYTSLASANPTNLDTSHIGNDTLSNIEKIIAGNFNDVLIGNGADNTITGESGNDSIDGGLGSDTAVYQGNKSQYTISNNNGTWTVTDSVSGRDGTDTLTNVEKLQFLDTLFTLTSGSTITGTSRNDNLIGTSGNDLINGLAGNDTLNGGLGNDTMVGGTGNDTYVVDSFTFGYNYDGSVNIDNTASDIVTESLNQGTDLVQSSVTYYLPDNVENLTLTGTANIDGTGNSLNNTITGNSGNNKIDGGLGNDTMIGGAGNDLYRVYDIGDVVTELAGGGIDTIKTNVSYTLSANVENMKLKGDSGINGTGNSLNNIIDGNGYDNILDGKAGADTMLGNAGNDTYIVDNVGDQVNETNSNLDSSTNTVVGDSTDAGGMDTVQVAIATAGGTYTLTNFVENGTLTNTVAYNLIGNTLNNTLTGNGSANTLNGGSGDDILKGGLGNDTLTGGTGADTFIFNTRLNASSNKDTITDFSHVDDTIQLSKSVMTALGAIGTLSANDFKLSTQTLDSSDRIIYNQTSGALFYDADGSGRTAAIQIAIIGNHPTDINYSDFTII